MHRGTPCSGHVWVLPLFRRVQCVHSDAFANQKIRVSGDFKLIRVPVHYIQRQSEDSCQDTHMSEATHIRGKTKDVLPLRLQHGDGPL